MASPLEILPNDVAGFLNADGYFSDVPVFLHREDQRLSEVTQALHEVGLQSKAGKAGAAVTVMVPSFDVEHPNAPGPHLIGLQTVRVYELPEVNLASGGTGKSAEQIVQQLSQKLLHLSAAGYYTPLFPARDHIIPVATPEEPIVVYELRWNTRIPLPQLDRVQVPTATQAPDGPDWTITLSCATAGATIKYSLGNEAFPSQTYVIPFSAVNGAIVRMVGIKSGLNSSNIGYFLVGT